MTGKWLKMDEAPRDGRQILTIGRWDTEIWYQTSFWSAQHSCWAGWPEDRQPTHYQPLPPPPAED